MVQLQQRVTYKWAGKEKSTKTVMARKIMGPIEPNGVQMWEEEKLAIPDTLPPSFLRGCSSISVSYDITVTIDPGVKFGTPIILGTVPYSHENIQRFMKALPWKNGEDAVDPPTNSTPDEQLPPPPRFAAPLPPPRFFMPPPPRRPPPHFRMPPPPFMPQPHSWAPPPPFVRRPPKPYYHASCNSQANRHHQHHANDEHVLKIEEIVD